MNDTKTTWVLQAQQGDTDAQGKLYEAYWEKTYRLALSMTKNPENARDAVQDGFLSAFEHLDSLRDPDAFSSWLCQIVANQCRKHLRQQKRFVSPTEDEDATDFFSNIPDADEGVLPESVLEDQAQRTLIRQTIEALPDNQRECVILFYYGGLSVKQIADIQTCSEGTVKSRLNYARQKIGESVLAIEKRDGIRLHSAVPIGLLLARLEVNLPSPEQLTQMWQAIKGGVSAAGAAGAAGAAAAAGGGEAAKGGLFATIQAKIAAGVAAVAVVTGGIVLATMPDPLVFTDPAMEQNIRILVDKPEGKLYAEDCDELYHIVLIDDGIADVSDAQSYDHLTVIPGTEPVSSLADLKLLPSLEALELYVSEPQTLLDTLEEDTPLPTLDTSFMNMQPIHDLSFLEKLPELKMFSCDLASGADLSPLAGNGTIRDAFLSISGDFSLDLSQMQELISLTLAQTASGDPTAVISLQATQPLPNLRMLQIYTGNLDSLAFAQQTPNLEYLSTLQLSQTPLDLTPLGTLQQLRYVGINNGSVDLSPLAGCAALEYWHAPQGYNAPPQAASDSTGTALQQEIAQTVNDLVWKEERQAQGDASEA
ncbi:MAG: sigma-70 family RNA polymerase sigma factor [Butyricicoccus sp.]|nr:sigma-70 family RNA polymerase sigma factor [Butyricicoccus sp.]